MFYTNLIEMSPVTESTVNITDTIDEKALLEAFELCDPDFDGVMEAMVNAEMQLNILFEGILMGDCALESSVLESVMSLEDATGVMEATVRDFKNKAIEIAKMVKRQIITFMDQVELLINQLTDRNKKFYEAHRQEISSAGEVVVTAKPFTEKSFAEGMKLGNDMIMALKKATSESSVYSAIEQVQTMYKVGNSFGEKVKEAFNLNATATSHSIPSAFAKNISITKMQHLQDIKQSKKFLLEVCDNMEKVTRSFGNENNMASINAIKSACNYGMTIINAQKQAVQEYANTAMMIMKKVVSNGPQDNSVKALPSGNQETK